MKLFFIKVVYLPATNSKGARVKFSSPDIKSITFDIYALMRELDIEGYNSFSISKKLNCDTIQLKGEDLLVFQNNKDVSAALKLLKEAK